MAKYEVFYVNIVPHPDTKGSKGWYIVEGEGLTNLDAEPDPWDADEVEGKAKAIERAKELARYVVDSKQAERATVYSEMVGGAIYTYPAKGSKAKKRRGGGKARHAPERSRLRPFATYCASCHKHISGTEHVWKIAGDKYLCNACGGATGGGKRRHGAKGYVTGDGRRFATMDAAISHANEVFRKRGVVIAVEAAATVAGRGGKRRHAGAKKPTVGKLVRELGSLLKS